MVDAVLNVQVNGKSRDIKMSYGLLNELSVTIGSVDALGNMPQDHELRKKVLEAILADRSPGGRVTLKVDIEDIDIDLDDIAKLIGWASEHLIDFFLKSAEKIKGTFLTHEERLTKLMTSSATGLNS